MAKKTVFRRLSKWLPLSPEQRDVLEHDADRFDPINVQYVDTPPARGVAALEGKIVEPEAVDTPANTEAEPRETEEAISAAQKKRLFAIADESGVTEDTLREHLKTLGIEHVSNIPKDVYDDIVEWTQAGGQYLPKDQ
jgi:D-alanyl-D-alanine carboxypeptidase